VVKQIKVVVEQEQVMELDPCKGVLVMVVKVLS
jgi:hypothetical protein